MCLLGVYKMHTGREGGHIGPLSTRRAVTSSQDDEKSGRQVRDGVVVGTPPQSIRHRDPQEEWRARRGGRCSPAKRPGVLVHCSTTSLPKHWMSSKQHQTNSAQRQAPRGPDPKHLVGQQGDRRHTRPHVQHQMRRHPMANAHIQEGRCWMAQSTASTWSRYQSGHRIRRQAFRDEYILLSEGFPWRGLGFIA